MVEEKNSLLAKLAEFEARFVELGSQLEDTAITADHTKLVAISKEYGKLKPLITKYQQYLTANSGIEDAQEILDDESNDEEFKALAKEEIAQLKAKKASLIEEMQNTLVMADDMDIKSVIIEIRAGTGGDEAALFARDLYNMYVKYSENRRWRTEMIEFSASEKGGFKEAIFEVKGAEVWSELGYEGGVHRVQRVPETESQGRVHTSAATVAVLPEPEEIDIEINPADVLEHVSRAGGPGGQSVNKLNSAIKLEHVPTGITVSMRDEKSQHKNRAKAWRILKSRIYEYHESKKRAERDSQRKSIIGSGDRSQKIRTYNFPQNRMTDHRINLSIYNLDKIIAGDLSEVIAALKDYDRQQRLKNL